MRFPAYEGPKQAEWGGRSEGRLAEGDVPTKASRPHEALIFRFELAAFPRSFPQDEGGTGIRKFGWHEPARLCTDHMRAGQRFGLLRRLQPANATVQERELLDLALGEERGFESREGATPLACRVPHFGNSKVTVSR